MENNGVFQHMKLNKKAIMAGKLGKPEESLSTILMELLYNLNH